MLFANNYTSVKGKTHLNQGLSDNIGKARKGKAGPFESYPWVPVKIRAW